MKSGYRLHYFCSWVSGGLGRAGLGGMAPTSYLTYSWVWWDDLHPVPGRVTAEMVLIQCVNPSSQVGMTCGKSQLRGGGIA